MPDQGRKWGRVEARTSSALPLQMMFQQGRLSKAGERFDRSRSAGRVRSNRFARGVNRVAGIAEALRRRQSADVSCWPACPLQPTQGRLFVADPARNAGAADFLRNARPRIQLAGRGAGWTSGKRTGLRPPIRPTRGLNRRVKSGPGPPAAEASCERRNKRSPRRRSKSFVSFKKFGAEAAGLQNPSFGPHAEPFASDRGRGLRDVDNAGSAALLAHSDRAADQQEIDSTPPWITRIIARVPVLCHTKTTSRDFSVHGWRWS
jgi:hypothetical protein